MPPIRRFVLRFALALGGVLVAAAAWDLATYDRDAWLDDYARVKRDMAQGYANLDWMVERRGLDLRALDAATTERIANAHSRVRAFLALRDFLQAFDDPHLRMVPGERPVPAARDALASEPRADVAQDPPAGADCAASGYEEGEHGFAFPFVAMPGWQALDDGDFPIGVVGDIGVLRIAQFGEDRYLAACNAVHRPGIGARALQLAVRARQQAQLRERLATLQARGAKRLLVDVTGNGGGSEWVSEVIALLSDRSLTRNDARIVGPRCDRGAVWSGAKPACPVFANAATQATTLQGTGAWRGPVLVLVDGQTASAAEDLVAWLKENGVAKAIGSRTAGAGCGYVDGGTVTRLAQVPVDVRMPNCARFLADGTNEVEGIAPDVVLPGGDEANARALRAALH